MYQEETMKKFFCLGLGVIMATGLVLAGTLKLDKPNGGEKWELGKVQQIQWTANGIGQKLRLVLLKNGARVGRIAGGLNASPGSYSWTVGNYEGGVAAKGDGFKVCVMTVDETVQDESDASFSIDEVGTGSGGSTQAVTLLSDREVYLAKPKLSLPNNQQVSVAKILRIDRIEPGVLTNAYGPSASAIGQGFSANQPVRTCLVAEAVVYHQQFKLNVSAWSDGKITFSRNQWMTPGDYQVYIGYEQPGMYQSISNQVPLRIEPSEYSYISLINPGTGIPGEQEFEVEITGLGFNKPHNSRGATLWFNNIPRPLSVTSWSDTLIRGHVSTLLIPASTECEFVVHHIKDGVTHYSNRMHFFINPR
jgi:hypothetical protein